MKPLSFASALIIAGLSLNTLAASPAAKQPMKLEPSSTKSEMMSSKFKKALPNKHAHDKAPIAVPTK